MSRIVRENIVKRAMIWFLSTIGFLTLLSFIGLAIAVFYLHKPSGTDHHITENTVLSLKLGHKSLTETGKNLSIPSFFALQNRLSLHQITYAIREASTDHRIKGILLEINGTAITTAQAQELRQAFEVFRQTGKFVYAFSRSYGDGNNGTVPYYLSTAADKIWLQPRGSVNFMGLMLETYFTRTLLDNYHVIPRLDTREAYKGLTETYMKKEFSPEVRQNLQSLFDGITDQIINNIAKDRGINVSVVKQHIQNGPFLDQEALSLKLIDHVGYLDILKEKIWKKIGKKPNYVSLKNYHRQIKLPRHSEKKIAVIFVDGTIMFGRKNLINEHLIDFDRVMQSLKRAREDEKVAAVILRIHSPGGVVTAAESIWREISLITASGKPVVASLGTVAASAGYMIAAPATKIVANPATITGSIGVAVGKLVLSGAFDHFGVHWDRIKTGQNAGMWSFTEDFSEQGWKKIQEMLDDCYQDFIAKVAAGRRMTPEAVREIAQGKVWTGAQAKENGLVDELGDFYTAVDVAKNLVGGDQKELISVESYHDEGGFMQDLQNFMDMGEKMAGIHQMFLNFQGNMTSGMRSQFPFEGIEKNF